MDHGSVGGNSLHVGQPAAEWNGAVIDDNYFLGEEARPIDRLLEKKL